MATLRRWMAKDVFGLEGTTIDNRYRVDAAIGEGGFGVVYRGFHLSFKRPVAVKCLKLPGHFTPEGQALFLEKFQEEGAFLSGLSHPSIVRVFDLNVTSSPRVAAVPYLVLEWLEGEELEERLEKRRRSDQGPMSEAEAITLMRPAVDAVALAHRSKIAHRDLKPANLFEQRSEGGSVIKVLDFGIAKAMQEGETATQLSTKTSSGFSAFSPQYGAPEQFSAKRFGATGPWTDVHALGLMLTELVSGKRPFDGEEMIEFYEGGTSPNRPTPRNRGATVSDAFEALCAKAVALDPRARFQNAGELGQALDAVAGARVSVEPPPRAAELVRPQPQTVVARPIALETAQPSTSTVVNPALRVPIAPGLPGAQRKRLPLGTVLLAGGGVVATAVVIGVVALSGDKIPKGASSTSGSKPARSSAIASTALSAVRPSAIPSDAPFALPRPRATPDTPAARISSTAACSAGMVTIPGGTFQMGSNDGERDERPVHPVTILTFCMDKTEVTAAAYQSCADGNGNRCSREHLGESTSHNALSSDTRCNYAKRTQHPVNCVSWDDAETYCRARDARLPTEEEWEYAARGGSEQRKYPWGDAEPGSQLCWNGLARRQQTCIVASFPDGASRWGVEDLAGNVWEWTASAYCPYGDNDCADGQRVNRGGGWIDDVAPNVRVSFRFRNLPAHRSPYLGFRCAKTP